MPDESTASSNVELLELCVAHPEGLRRELDSIRHSAVVVGIPSYNEADTIAHVVRQADEGLQRYFPDRGCLIVNCDNHSPDGTRRVFLETDTQTNKLYVSTPEGVRGKGNNFLNLFHAAQRLDSRVIVVVDADLESITPEWIDKLAGPVVSGEADFVTPLYSRNEYDGSITNHICYPLLRGILDSEIRQPIGGDFGLSGEFAAELLRESWQPTTREYGIDISLTLGALLGDRRIVQVPLGAKVHKPSAPKLGPMFTQVVTTLFASLLDHRGSWRREGDPPELVRSDAPPPQALAVDYKATKALALALWSEQRQSILPLLDEETGQRLDGVLDDGPMRVDRELWCHVVYELLHAYEATGRDANVIEGMKPLYFARSATFMRESMDLGHAESEELILEQARHFRHERAHLFDRFA